MPQSHIMFGLTDIVCGVVFILVSIPLVKRQIKMNKAYGFRIPKAFESDDNWYKINEYGGRQMIIWSVFLILAGVLCFFFPMDDSSKDPIGHLRVLLPLVLFTTIAIIKTFLYSRKL